MNYNSLPDNLKKSTDLESIYIENFDVLIDFIRLNKRCLNLPEVDIAPEVRSVLPADKLAKLDELKKKSEKKKRQIGSDFYILYHDLVKKKKRAYVTEYIEFLIKLMMAIYNRTSAGKVVNIIDLNREVNFYKFGLTFDQGSAILYSLKSFTEGRTLEVKPDSKKNYRTISRCFSLTPLSDLPDEFYKYFTKNINLKNHYIGILLNYIKNDNAVADLKKLRRIRHLFGHNDDKSKKIIKSVEETEFYELFSGTGSDHIKKKLFGFKNNPGMLFGEDESEFSNIEFNTRTYYSAGYGAYNAFRNWIIRNEDLWQLCQLLPKFLREPVKTNWKYSNLTNLDFFFLGKPFLYERVKDILTKFKYNCFGKERDFSKDYLNNHMLQLRNLVFDRLDFRLSEIYLGTSSSSAALSGLKKFIWEGINTLIDYVINNVPNSLIDDILDEALGDFKKKSNGTYVSVPRGELPEKFANDYIRSIKNLSTKWAKAVLKLEDMINNKNNVNRLKQLVNQQNGYLRRIESITGIPATLYNTNNGWSNLNEFKKKRDSLLNSRLPDVFNLKSGRPTVKNQFDLDKLLREGLKEVLEPFFSFKPHYANTVNDIYVLNYIFRAPVRRHAFKSSSFSDFESYVIIRMANNIRSCLSEFFIKFRDSNNKSFENFLSDALDYIGKNIYCLTKYPVFGSASVNFFTRYEYQGDYCSNNSETSYAYISFVTREWLKFLINDNKKIKIKEVINGQTIIKNYNSRIGELILNRGAIPLYPVLTYRDGKLLLNLPFKVKKVESSKRPEGRNFLVGGVDLGLRHFAVLSIKDGSGGLVRRYFINHRIVDYKFAGGTFIKRNPGQKNPSDIKGRLRNIRRVIRITQAKTGKFEAFIKTLDADLSVKLKKAKAFELKALNSPLKAKLSGLSARLPTGASQSFFKNAVNKYIKRKEFIERLWRRLNNINKHLANLVARTIADIAKYHGVYGITFEDLKWSQNSRKKDVGKFLAYWQVHWFYSRIQEITEGLCSSDGIEVIKTNPRGTSQLCGWCGRKGVRSGAWFTCTNNNCPHLSGLNTGRRMRGKSPVQTYRVNSDLNAARNIADRGIKIILGVP